MTTLPQTAPMRFPRPAVSSHLAPMSSPGQLGPMQGQGGPGQPGINLTGADVMRVLRANLWLIVIMLFAFGIAGFFFNKWLQKYHSRYTAHGLLLVYGNDEIPFPGHQQPSANPAEIELVQRTQAQTFLHESNFLKDIQSPDSLIRNTAWFVQYNGKLDEAKIDLAENLSANPIPNSRLIDISMTCANPDDSRVIVKELVDHHIQTLKDDQYGIEGKKIELLDKEKNLLDLELNEDVLKKLAQKELALGGDSINTFQQWNGKQQQLSRLIEERMRILTEIEGYKSRRDSLARDLEEGRVPPDIEQRIRDTGTYTQFRNQVISLNIELKRLEQFEGRESAAVVETQRMKDAWQAEVDEEHEELKSTLTDGMTAALENEIKASTANLQRIDTYILQTGTELGTLNQSMGEYRVLQKKEANLRDKLDRLQDQLSEMRQFSLNSPWTAAKWSALPVTPDRPSFPKLPLTMAVSLVLGLVLSLGIAFLREMTDTTVRNDRDIAKVGQLNLLGMIQHEADDPQSAGARLPLAIFDAPQSVVAEQFRQMRTKLLHTAALDTTRSILVTSPSPGDGKSTVACNIATGLALNGRRILLVDANFRKPSLHAIFGLDNAVGFSDLLNDISLFDTAVAETEVPNLSVLVSGERPSNPTELLESQLFIDFVERALEEYDHVIFDTGPLLVVADTAAMAPRVDGVITVVRARGNSRGLLMRMRDELRKIKAEHLGVVLNAVRSQGGGYYGNNIKTYYAYQNQ
jgi:succinoglycan biosynthesis transport protein ExoP